MERRVWSKSATEVHARRHDLGPNDWNRTGEVTDHRNGEIGSDQRHFQGILGIDEPLLCVAADIGVEIFLWVSSLLVAWEDRISAL